MEKKIKDYLHYYIGQQAMCRYPHGEYVSILITGANLHDLLHKTESCRPILRPLFDIFPTEFEALKGIIGYPNENATIVEVTKEYIKYEYTKSNQYKGLTGHLLFRKFPPGAFHYLLQKGFDIFGLADAGLAAEVFTIR